MSQPERNLTDCETLRELIPAYSVGATDAEETALVERLLPLCPEAAIELDEYLAMGQAMLRSVPMAQPPAALHDKLMAAVSNTAAPTTTIRPAAHVKAPAPAAPVGAAQARPRGRRVNRWIAAFALAAAALLIISNIYWLTHVDYLNRQQEAITALLHSREDALASLGTGRANRVQLVSTDTQAPNHVLATVLWTPQSPTALLYTDNLPTLSTDKAYQVWLIKGTQPISAGVFQLDAQGVGVLIFNSDQPITDFSAVAISTERAGGSDQPTTTPIAAAQLS